MKYINDGLSTALFEAISKSNYDPRKSKWNVISLTALLDSPKVRNLKIRHWEDVEEKASDCIARFIGSAVHDKISEANRNSKTEILAEERVYLNCETFEVHTVAYGTHVADQEWYNEDSWFISMQWDAYTMLSDTEGILEDHKVTTAWTLVFDPMGKPGWEEQLNVVQQQTEQMAMAFKNQWSVFWDAMEKTGKRIDRAVDAAWEEMKKKD